MTDPNHGDRRPRPGLLTLIGVVSLIWSSLTLIASVVGVVVLLLVGGASWLAGPAAGAVGTFLAVLVLAWIAVSSCTSVLLFLAGWKTVHDDPEGIRLHRLWAWISIGLDVVGLMLSGGTAPNSWTGLIYAAAVLYVTGLPEVLAYHGHDPAGLKAKPPGGWTDDLA